MSSTVCRMLFALCVLIVAAHGSARSRDAEAAPHNAAADAQGAQYPIRPVRFIVPFPPGGGTDIVGRLVSQKLSEKFRQQFIIDNRPGAASVLGSAIAAKAAPDGYTLLLITASFAIAAGYYRELPYDALRDFDAVGQIASAPLVFVVHPAVPARTIKELVAAARAHPDRFNYASGGEGGINHLPAEMFKNMTGAGITHVPYKGAGPALTALLGGEAHLMIATVGSCLPHLQSGKLRALALAGARRSALLPDLPTVAESGLAGYAADNWYAVVAPRNTPRVILHLLNRETDALGGSSEIRDRFAALGFEAAASTPQEFARYLPSEITKWRKAIQSSGIARQ